MTERTGILNRSSVDWVEELIEDSELNTGQLINLERELFEATQGLADAQAQWDAQYFDFLMNEDAYKDTAGVKSWNDSKRLEFVKANWPNAWDNVQRWQNKLNELDASLKQVKARISHINRVIRLLGFVYGNPIIEP